MPPEAPQFFTVEDSEAGLRLDRVVTGRYPNLSRTRVQELIETALILIDGHAAKGAQKLRSGQRIEVQVPERPPILAEAEAIPLTVLFEDDDLLAIDKPAGMVVHAGAGVARGTLVNALLGRGQALSQGGDALRPGIVHRLDKETSGVILVAKNDFAHAKLGEAFRARAIRKTYIALVHGVLRGEHGRIDLPIGRDPVKRIRMTTQRKTWHGEQLSNPREARTDWRAVLRIDASTLVEVQLHTGRTHQIRVHFSALKHPVVGDTLYGAPVQLRVGQELLPPLDRNFLHAAKLGFAQPRTGQWIEVRAPLPASLRAFVGAAAEAAKLDPLRIDAALSPYL